jgi:hypothetical protein
MKPAPVVELTDELIAQFKASFGRVFRKELLGHTYVFRPLSRKEYIEVLNFVEDNKETLKLNDIDEKCFDLCLLYPTMSAPEKATLPAGVVPTIAKSIQQKSGFEISDVFGTVVPAPPEIETLSDIDPWPDPSEDVVATLHAKTPHRLVLVKSGPYRFIVRGLGRFEWNTLVTQQDVDGDLTICKKATLWPEVVDWNGIPAGVVPSISQAIMRSSGFDLTTEVEEL